MLKYAITIGLALMFSIQIAYGQVMEPVLPGTENSVSNQGLQPVPDNQLSNSGIIPKDNELGDSGLPKKTITLEDNEIAFHFTMINGEMNSIYKLCGGIMGNEILNFGCDQKQWTAEVDTGRNRLGHIWVFSLQGDIGRNQLYGCIIGETEKKISCDTTNVPTPPTEQELIIDWSQPSATGLPSTFSQTPGEESIDRSDIQRQGQGQGQSQSDNDSDNNEDDNNNNSEEDH